MHNNEPSKVIITQTQTDSNDVHKIFINMHVTEFYDAHDLIEALKNEYAKRRLHSPTGIFFCKGLGPCFFF